MLSEMKKVELKRRAEAVATQRQELMIPLMQHRRFSETVAIDHRAKPHEMQVDQPHHHHHHHHHHRHHFVALSTLLQKHKKVLTGCPRSPVARPLGRHVQ